MWRNGLFHTHSIKALVQSLATGDLAPEEMAEASIDRIDLYNSSYKVFVAHEPDRLRNAAAASRAHLLSGGPVRPLEAVPLGIKDTFNTADLPTQMGSRLWAGFTPGNDARAVFNCRRDGALVAGKTVTSEFAVHAPSETLNPYDPVRISGTSSSGSAVAVAMGMTPAALATQTADSIVSSASFCGVYGCKPSFGLIPRTGILKAADTLDTVGFFSLHSEDLRLLLDALRVHGLNHPISHAALADPQRRNAPQGRPWRIATADLSQHSAVPAYAQKSFTDFINTVQNFSGFEIVELPLPQEFQPIREVHAALYSKAFFHSFGDGLRDKEQLSPAVLWLLEQGKAVTAEQYRDALLAQTRIAKAMDDFFADCDAMVCLATNGVAPLRDEKELPTSGLPWTAAYLPTVCAPAFRSTEGLPFGIQILARRYDDYKLFALIDALCEKSLLPTSSGVAR